MIKNGYSIRIKSDLIMCMHTKGCTLFYSMCTYSVSTYYPVIVITSTYYVHVDHDCKIKCYQCLFFSNLIISAIIDIIFIT